MVEPHRGNCRPGEGAPGAPGALPPAARARIALWIVLAAAALVLTTRSNLAFLAGPGPGGIAGFLALAFSNPAASSLGWDLVFLSLAVLVWMVAEGRRLGIRGLPLYVAASLLVAISVAFPLFLVARERRMARRG